MLAPLFVELWAFPLGVLTLAEWLPAELALPDVPVTPVWLAPLLFIPLESEPPVGLELCDDGMVELAPALVFWAAARLTARSKAGANRHVFFIQMLLSLLSLRLPSFS